MIAPYLFIALAALALVLAAAALLLVLRLQSSVADRLHRLQALHSDVRALTSAAVGVGERVHQIERRQRQLTERQDRLDLSDGANQPYEQAIRLVHKGANADEIVEICGLSRGEAELIGMLHRLDQSA